MEIFFSLLLKLIPFYAIILLGFLGSRFLSIQKETIAKLLIYIVVPVVVFYGTYKANLSLTILSLPILFFLICSSLAIIFFYIGKLFFKDSLKYIFSFTAGAGNFGYFGLPVALMLFGEKALSLAILSILGIILYESSIGFFIVAQGNHSIKQSFLKVVKLPSIYAFFIGIIVNLLKINLGENILTTFEQFKGAYTILGMMIIGLGLAKASLKHFDFKFISLSFFIKFVIWPVLVFSIIYLDKKYLHFYNNDMYNIMTLMSIVPMGANTVTLATEFKVHPEKAAVAVLLSTIFALIYIPLFTTFLWN